MISLEAFVVLLRLQDDLCRLGTLVGKRWVNGGPDEFLEACVLVHEMQQCLMVM